MPRTKKDNDTQKDKEGQQKETQREKEGLHDDEESYKVNCFRGQGR